MMTLSHVLVVFAVFVVLPFVAALLWPRDRRRR